MDDRSKVLDVQMPKEEQEKPEFIEKLKEKKYKWQVSIKDRTKIRFLLGNDPEILQDFAKAKGYKIVKVERL